MQAMEASNRILSYFDQPLLRGDPLHIAFILGFGQDSVQVALKVGINRMYVVSDIPTWIDSYFSKRPYQMGKGFTLDAQNQCLSDREERVLHLLNEYTYLYGLMGVTLKKKYITLPLTALTRLMDTMGDHPFYIMQGEELSCIAGQSQEPLPLSFSLEKEENGLRLHCHHEGIKPFSPDCAYVLLKNKLYHLTKEQRETLAPFLLQKEKSFFFSFGQAEQFLSEVLPRLQAASFVQVQEEITRFLVSEPLVCKAYLDREERNLNCKLEFLYAERVIDPFSVAKEKEENILLLRDSEGEHRVLSLLSQYGFHVRPGIAYLKGEETLYTFLTQGMEALRACAQVYVTEALLGMKPRRIKPSGQLHFSSKGHFLQLSLDTQQLSPEDMLALMRALRERKKYVCLRDGSFLSLEEDGWAQLAELSQSAKEEEDAFLFEAYQAPVLLSLLEGLDITRTRQVSELVKNLTRIPENGPLPFGGMRPYQEKGYYWLHTLSQLKMGGILADEMGLGKTVQVLALIQSLSESGQGVALCVVPTSLLYNWAEEAQRFTPHLKVLVCQGSAKERDMQIAQCSSYDLILTSYAQMRRDIDALSQVDFSLCILDEAQHIKNAASQSFRAARRLRAQARFALTGTPMENHMGELWALFDFALPGFLGELPDFSARYMDSPSPKDFEALHQRIAPFLLRRLKKDVLKDLPPKIEHDMMVDMTPEQHKVYLSVHDTLLRQLQNAQDAPSTGRGRMRTLAAITRLRQLCCHPSLYLDGYEGSSGKLHLALELIAEAVEGGHYVLLFSQFTQMLDILRRHLRSMGLSYLYLDGDTPARERVNMVKAFNACEANVFLISLKAGGFGLNLTNADVVIQYDPWWNPAVEEQASDRAHRIGQTHTVQVIRLVTRDSVEERVMALKEEKRNLIAQAISGGEVSIRNLNEEELRNIFGL